MTTEQVHTCSYYCDRPGCLKAQRDELRDRLEGLDAEKGGDANVEAVRAKLLHRSRVGLAKYGVTTERTDLTRADWLNHLQEELMDACVYIEAARLNELFGNSEQLPTPPAQAAEAVERVAEALWVSCSTKHKLLEKAGYAIDWASQPNIIKRDYHKQARAAIAAMQAGEGKA